MKNENFKKDLALQVAIRRLVFSLDRERYDDKLIDTMIGFEALLFKDIKGEDYKGELRYRFSHRAAFFLEDEPQKREIKFMTMRKAYDLRSTLVHGENPKEPIKIQGEEFKIGEFILLIQEEFRQAILKYLRLPTDKRPDKPDQWNKVLFTGVGWFISFFDFSSFVVMKELGVSQILTADKHFEDVGLGFKKLF